MASPEPTQVPRTLHRAFTVGWTTKGLQLKERAGKVRPTTRENWSCPTIPLYFLTGYYPLWTKVLPRGWQIFRRLYRSADEQSRRRSGCQRAEALDCSAKKFFWSKPRPFSHLSLHCQSKNWALD